MTVKIRKEDDTGLRGTSVHKGRGVRYVMKVTGYFREQVFRLIRQYVKTGKIARRERSATQKFARRYTAA